MTKRICNGRTGVRSLLLACAIATAMAGTASAQGDKDQGNGHSKQFEQDGPTVSPHELNYSKIGAAPIAGGTAAVSPITYHHGPVMVTPKVYLIWYGDWNQSNGTDTASGQQIVRDFVHGVSNSPYFQTNTTYNGPSGLVLAGTETTVTAAKNSRLSDNQVFSVVATAINSGKLPVDSTGVYFVVTSSDIAKSGFCNQYCGWHTYGTIGGTSIKYSFIGNAARCINNCAMQSIGPNGNAGVDGMISVMAHELEEATTDPQLNAWYDASGAENGDKCAWTFGQNSTLLSSGAYYNMTMPTLSGYRNYLIQRDLSAADNKCYVNFVTKAQ
jgi:hypothetical protein